MRITVVGSGYVGSTTAVLLAKQHDVFMLDKNVERVNNLNNRQSPIGDVLMEEALADDSLNLTATTDSKVAFDEAEYIIIATNTNLDPETGVLDVTTVRCVVDDIASFFNEKISAQPGREHNAPTIVIKSTVPTGLTEELQSAYPQFVFLFCPEFLREKTAMEDVLNPSRIIVGWVDASNMKQAETLADLIYSCVDKKDAPILITTSSEAEAIKLFSNSYLALRIAFFNELDTFAKVRGLDSERMIKGVCMDPRIGDWYNIPGPGFGGNCLPKDTRQLVADFDSVPEFLIRAALEENEVRKEFTQEE